MLNFAIKIGIYSICLNSCVLNSKFVCLVA